MYSFEANMLIHIVNTGLTARNGVVAAKCLGVLLAGCYGRQALTRPEPLHSEV